MSDDKKPYVCYDCMQSTSGKCIAHSHQWTVLATDRTSIEVGYEQLRAERDALLRKSDDLLREVGELRLHVGEHHCDNVKVVTQLKEQLTDLHRLRKDLSNALVSEATQVGELKVQVTVAVEALEWISLVDREQHNHLIGGPVIYPCGKRAAEAFAKIKGEEK